LFYKAKGCYFNNYYSVSAFVFNKFRLDLFEPNDSGLKLSLSRAASLLDRRGEASQSMGQRIKRFDFVSRDSPQVGFESRVMGDYPARFGEHF